MVNKHILPSLPPSHRSKLQLPVLPGRAPPSHLRTCPYTVEESPKADLCARLISKEPTSSTLRLSPSNSFVLPFSFPPSYSSFFVLSLSQLTPTSSLPLHQQEPRKSDAPQLRDEYRSYKILSGCRSSLFLLPLLPRLLRPFSR